MNKISLTPERTLQKALISTTSTLKGDFKSESMAISRVMPQFHGATSYIYETRSVYAISFLVELPEPAPGMLVEDLSYIVDHFCTVLSILYGKRIDNHGTIEQQGCFTLPNLEIPYLNYSEFSPIHSKEARINYSIPLELDNFSAVEDLFVREDRDMHFVSILMEAGRYYAKALRSAESEPEIAYLHLITAAEILSNYYQYDMEDLVSKEIYADLIKIKECVGNATHNRISSHLRSSKSKSIKALMNLIDDDFYVFSHRAADARYFSPTNIEQSLKSAYDLRSRYVHSGVPFGHWIKFDVDCYDLNAYELSIADREYSKIMKNAPTLSGLESVMRYCLLKFMLENGVKLPQTPKATVYVDNR